MRFFYAMLVVVLALPAKADVFDWVTPSGNIYCQVGIDLDQNNQVFSDIYCRIHERSGPPVHPILTNCPNGHAFMMGDRGPVKVQCDAGGRPSGQSVAPYGETGRYAGITCNSERTGLTCTNADGHGFFLSRRAQRAY